MAFRFEDLKVWQNALTLFNKIDLLTKEFPKNELFSLCNQMKRAADSVVLNIAERSTGQTVPKFRRFLNMALRSAIEVVACLFIAKSRSYRNETDFQLLYSEYETLCKMITKLRDSFV